MSAFDPKRTFGSENCCTQIYVASDGGKNLVIAAHCHNTVKSFGLSDIGGRLGGTHAAIRSGTHSSDAERS